MRSQVVKNIEKEFMEPSFTYLVKNGLENTSVRDLCKEMNISYGSIYYWFEGKNDIYINVVKYGIRKVAGKLFKFAFDTIQTPEVFLAGFLDEVDKYILEFRLIYQMTSSPVYGPALREKSTVFKDTYEEYIARMTDMCGCSIDDMTPIIYLLISILSDYVVWEDRKSSEIQLKFLSTIIKDCFKK